MPLLDVQRSLVGFARGSTEAFKNCSDLEPHEHEWLMKVLDSPGLNVTQQIQQWWRISRVLSTANMTVELLKRNDQADLIIDYITTEPIRTLFFSAELEQFKKFLHTHPRVDQTTQAVIAFEAGIKTAMQVIAANTIHSDLFPVSLTFWRNPSSLFTALITGSPLPPMEPNPYYLEINPQLESLWICHKQQRISKKNHLAKV